MSLIYGEDTYGREELRSKGVDLEGYCVEGVGYMSDGMRYCEDLVEADLFLISSRRKAE